MRFSAIQTNLLHVALCGAVLIAKAGLALEAVRGWLSVVRPFHYGAADVLNFVQYLKSYIELGIKVYDVVGLVIVSRVLDAHCLYVRWIKSVLGQVKLNFVNVLIVETIEHEFLVFWPVVCVGIKL